MKFQFLQTGVLAWLVVSCSNEAPAALSEAARAHGAELLEEPWEKLAAFEPIAVTGTQFEFSGTIDAAITKDGFADKAGVVRPLSKLLPRGPAVAATILVDRRASKEQLSELIHGLRSAHIIRVKLVVKREDVEVSARDDVLAGKALRKSRAGVVSLDVCRPEPPPPRPNDPAPPVPSELRTKAAEFQVPCRNADEIPVAELIKKRFPEELVGIGLSTDPRNWQPPPPPQAPPAKRTVAVGSLKVSAGLTAEEVRNTIEARKSQLLYAYEKSLIRNPGLPGTVTAKIEIGVKGRPELVEIQEKEIAGSEFERELTRPLTHLYFPEPVGGKPVSVTVEIVFAP